MRKSENGPAKGRGSIGRPKAASVKDHWITFRVTAEEHFLLTDKAQRSGMVPGVKAIGASSEELAEARSKLVKLTLRDLGATATNGSYVPSHLGEEAVEEWHTFRRTEELSDPDFVEKWLAKHNALGVRQREVIAAMRWIRENRDIRDEAQYLLTKMQADLELQPDAGQ